MTDHPHNTEPDAAAPAPEPGDPQSVEGLFMSALGQASAKERAAFLDEACGDDADRRMRVDALLRAYEDAGSFLEKPPVGSAESHTVSLDFLAPSDDPGLLGMLGAYEVYEVLGRGGMGIVFRARDPKLNRVVAIKVLAPELAANPNARRRFLREARAAASISHPHVVTIHAVDEGTTATTLPFLVMECIVGQTLQQKLDKQGSLRLTEILRIGQQLACGLAAAHKQGVIHRDIKPANILLENGVERVKITDFGLARAADDVSITRTGEVSGTPQYMSPEQAQGDPVDHRSDLFSLGSVLYAMCTGRSPFRATTLAAAIRRVCDDSPRPIAEINPEVPAWLIDIVNRLLEKDPDNRPQSAEEVESLLSDRLAGVQQPRVSRPPAPHRAASPRVEPQTPHASRRLAGIDLPIRACLWISAIILLVPLVLSIGGMALGLGIGEVALVAGIICAPLGTFLLASTLMDPSLYGRPWADALFLLICFLLGPFGILLYLVRRDQVSNSPPVETSSPPTHVVGQTEETPAEMPDWPRRLIWGGFVLIALPWLPIAYGAAVGNGDPMEFGGRLVLPALGFGLMAIIGGWITKLVAQRTEGSPSAKGSRLWRRRIHDTAASPWRVLGWMIVAGVVLVPGCLVASFVYINAARVASRQHSTVGVSSVESFGEDQSNEPMPLESALLFEIESPGLLVRLVDPQSGDDVSVLPQDGRSHQTFLDKDNTYSLPAGTYDVAVYDDRAGWKTDETDPRFIQGQVTVVDGEFTALKVRRNLRLLSEQHPDWSETGFFTFHWGRAIKHWQKGGQQWSGERPVEHSLTRPQAFVVQTLLLANADGQPEVNVRRLVYASQNEPVAADDSLGVAADADDAPDLSAVFNDGQHPAWGKLVVPGKQAETYRLPALKELESKTSGSPSAEGGRANPTTTDNTPATSPAGSMAITDGQEVSTTVMVHDDGLLVALRRISVFDGSKGPEQTVTKYGGTTFALQPGDYELLIRDRLFGFGDIVKTVTIGDAGSVQELHVRRDLLALAKDNTNILRNRFRWDGDEYHLPRVAERLAVSRLMKAHIEGEPEVSEDALMKMLLDYRTQTHLSGLFGETKPERLADVFDDSKRLSREDVPAWGNLIVPGETDGTYRLAPLVRGTLKVTGDDDGMSVFVTPVKKGPRFSERTLASGQSLELPPGDYLCHVRDAMVGWGDGFILGAFVRQQSVTVAEGATVTVSSERQYADYLDPPEVTTKQPYITFSWFPTDDHISGTHLNADERASVLVLLQALADGSPDVSEAEVLKQSGFDDETKFNDAIGIFGSASQGKLVVPGETDGTWRLKPPPTSNGEEPDGEE